MAILCLLLLVVWFWQIVNSTSLRSNFTFSSWVFVSSPSIFFDTFLAIASGMPRPTAGSDHKKRLNCQLCSVVHCGILIWLQNFMRRCWDPPGDNYWLCVSPSFLILCSRTILGFLDIYWIKLTVLLLFLSPFVAPLHLSCVSRKTPLPFSPLKQMPNKTDTQRTGELFFRPCIT